MLIFKIIKNKSSSLNIFDLNYVRGQESDHIGGYNSGHGCECVRYAVKNARISAAHFVYVHYVTTACDKSNESNSYGK